MTATDAIAVTATAGEARELTDRIKVAVEGTWQLIKQAYLTRAWGALGYDSWDDYCTREFGTSRLRLPREERQEVVASFRDIGMSTRAIASATGMARNTVRGELRQVGQSDPPEPTTPIRSVQAEPLAAQTMSEREAVEPPAPRPITGIDGKVYPIAKAAPPPEPVRTERRVPLTADLMKLSGDLRRITNRVDKLHSDDRFPRNAEQVAIRLRGDLLRAVEVCQDLLDELPALKNATTNTEEGTK